MKIHIHAVEQKKNLLTIKLKGNKLEGYGRKTMVGPCRKMEKHKKNIEFFMVFLQTDITNYKTLIITPLPHSL